jgi:hypothetical protein
MLAPDVKQRTIFLGNSNQEWQLTTLCDEFKEEVESAIDRYKLKGVNIHFDRKPVSKGSQGDEEPVIALHAKVTWPHKDNPIVGLLEVQDVLDKYDLNPPPLPPL